MKALKTPYKGFLFQSRTEAKIAFFLDRMGEPWEYEPEAFDLGELCYLPDFYLGRFRARLEVKGTIVNDKAGLRFLTQCGELARQSGRPVILSFGDAYDGYCSIFSGEHMHTEARWTICPYCARLAFAIALVTWCPGGHKEQPILPYADQKLARRRLYEAALEARQYRFGVSRREHQRETATHN